jgi:hypothetical protein
MRRPFALTSLALVLAVGCSTSTAPVDPLIPDPTLDVATAHARWRAFGAIGYTFEIEVQGSSLPSPGYYYVVVEAGKVTSAHLMVNAEPRHPREVPSIDQLWAYILSAAASKQLYEPTFTRDGIPITVMTGSFANDSGTRFTIRSFAVHLTEAPRVSSCEMPRDYSSRRATTG